MKTFPPGPPWYGEGLRFACTQCGNCCSGPPGYVWVDRQEEQRIAELLRVSVREFRKRYTRAVHGRRSLIERPGGDCVFLTEDRQCAIHAEKPRQCLIFPFWPRIVASEEAWTKAGTRCPGIGQGPLWNPGQIRRLTRTETDREELLSLLRGPDEDPGPGP